MAGKAEELEHHRTNFSVNDNATSLTRTVMPLSVVASAIVENVIDTSTSSHRHKANKLFIATQQGTKYTYLVAARDQVSSVISNTNRPICFNLQTQQFSW